MGGVGCFGHNVAHYKSMISAHQQYMAENGGVIVNIIADMFRGFPMMANTGKTSLQVLQYDLWLCL